MFNSRRTTRVLPLRSPFYAGNKSCLEIYSQSRQVLRIDLSRLPRLVMKVFYRYRSQVRLVMRITRQKTLDSMHRCLNQIEVTRFIAGKKRKFPRQAWNLAVETRHFTLLRRFLSFPYSKQKQLLVKKISLFFLPIRFN